LKQALLGLEGREGITLMRRDGALAVRILRADIEVTPKRNWRATGVGA
jgi:hypothetical protein